MRFIFLVSLLAIVAACASTPSVPDAPLNLASPTGSSAPPQARLYADCVVASTQASTFERAGNTILFHCTGEPAQHFYDGLAAWTATNNSEFTAEGRTVRVPVRPERDLAGLDHCWRAASGAYGCTVVLNVGEFLGAE